MPNPEDLAVYGMGGIQEGDIAKRRTSTLRFSIDEESEQMSVMDL
jgi:hypothetical protein